LKFRGEDSKTAIGDIEYPWLEPKGYKNTKGDRQKMFKREGWYL
jgi:hypothetical protein